MSRRNWIVSVCVFLVWSNIPAVPASWAAVIPNPVYRLTWLSIWRIVKITLFPFPGMLYQFTIYTIVAVALIIGTGFLARHVLLKYLPSFKENTNGQDQES
ncbi:MAG: hypothetical protein H8D34_20840 [Chloroflexi bacterium]|nr:hypothetical protein [Chloroflexota bacterium]